MSALGARSLLDLAVAPLDSLRTQLFVWALRSPRLGIFALNRERRLCLTLSLRALLAFVMAVYAPVLLFVLGPIALGVPHVAADLRYLVARRRLARWWRTTIVAACTLLIAFHVLEQASIIESSDVADFSVVSIWAGLGIVAGVQRSGARWRALIASAVVLIAAAFAWLAPTTFRVVLLHGHNLLALVVWPVLFGERSRRLRWLLLFTLCAAALLASGVLFRASLSHVAWNSFRLHPLELADLLAPDLRADYALGLTSAFVFLQVAHYAVWLAVIPQTQIRGRATLTFRMSARALLADLGRPLVAALASSVGLVLVFACSNPVRASLGYVSIAIFHAYLELVLLAYLFVARASDTRALDHPTSGQLADISTEK